MTERGFCEAIRQIRKDEHLTLQQFSKRSGINISQLSRIEHGHFPGRIQTLKNIQRGLDLTNIVMLNLLGFRNAEYRRVPVLSTNRIGNFGRALAKAKVLSFVADTVPKSCFMVQSTDDMLPLICKNAWTLVNRDFKLVNGKIYAILLKHEIIIGKVYFSNGGNEAIFITNDRCYFKDDYLGRSYILGQVVRVINNINKTARN